jgi:hypothetical protein
MQYDIRQEAGEEFAGLGRLIEEMTPEITPLVEEVTALPLPKTITIRIVTVPEWMRLWADHDERLLAAEVEALSLTYEEAEQGRAFLTAKREAHRGMAVGAQTVRYDEYASVIVLADNLLTAGHFKGGTWNTDYLRTVIAHELTHVGQDTAGGEGYRLLTTTPFPQLRQHAGRAWTFACEGHAVWADELVNTRMGRDPRTPIRPAHGSVPAARWSGGAMRPEVLDHIRAAGSTGALGSAQNRKTLRWYADSGRKVREVITACGLQAVNRIWTQHDLLPTAAEEHDPLAWQRRLTGLPPRIDGLGDFAAGLIPGAGTRSFVIKPPGRP